MDEFQTDTKLDSEEALRKSVRRKVVIGVAMMVSLPFMPIVVFYIQYSVSNLIVNLVIAVFAVIGFTGLILMMYFGIGSSMLLHNFELFRNLSPPDPMILGRTVVLNRDPVYLVGQWGSNAIFFVAFHQAERTFELKTRVPRVFWKWEYTHQIGDVKVARREGTFTIPVDDGMYLSGSGIIYSLLVERGYRIRLKIDYTAEQLNEIVDHLANEVQSDESGF